MVELSQICALCNDSALDYNDGKKTFGKVGEATETALVVLAEKMNVVGVDKAGLTPKDRATCVSNAMKKDYVKVKGRTFGSRFHDKIQGWGQSRLG